MYAFKLTLEVPGAHLAANATETAAAAVPAPCNRAVSLQRDSVNVAVAPVTVDLQ